MVKMIKKLVFILFLCSAIGYSQTLENQIYNHLDQFVKQPNPKRLKQLATNASDFSKQVKTDQEHLALVVLYCNMGYYFKQYENPQKATLYYEKASSIYYEKQLAGYDIIEYCLKPLGNLYTILGDFANAESRIKQYIVLAEKQKNTTQQIAGIINLSVVYHNMSKHHTAIDLLREGLAIPDLNAKQKSALENNLATNLLALQKFQEAESFLYQDQTDDLLKLRNKAQIAAQQDNFDKAFSILEQVESQLIKNQPLARDLARFYVEKASLYKRTNNIQKAINTYEKALQILIPESDLKSVSSSDRLYAEITFISIFDALATLESNPQKALLYYDFSFYVSSLLYEGYTNQEVKIIHQSSWKRRTEKCLEILFNLYLESKDEKYINRAFKYVEKSKSRVLRERFLDKSLLEQHPKDKLLQEREKLKALQENYINALLQEELTPKNSKKNNLINDSISIINFKLKAIQNKILLKYPDTLSQVISIKELQQKINDDDVSLVLFFFGKNNLYRFDIYNNKINLQRIEINEGLHQQISEFIDYFNDNSAINNDIETYRNTAFKLYKVLMPENFYETKNLLIIPDGILYFVPFEALLFKSSQSTSYASMPFLIQRKTVSYHTSATLYYNSKIPEVENSMLGVFPVFENSSNFLRYSIDEAKQLSLWIDSKQLMHEEANKQNFKDLAQQYSILHLSTHARSGTFTAPATLDFYDDAMQIQELYSLNLNPKLVVLSACETGVGKIQTGVEPMSIARGFQYAGAQNLLFSLWEVNDLSTSQLMSSFYKYYSKSNSASAANRKSKLDFLKNKNITNAQKSPYYWSSFVYYGALDNQSSEPHFSMLFIIIGLVIIFIAIYLIKRRFKS